VHGIFACLGEEMLEAFRNEKPIELVNAEQ
jgi:hypothetical protein